MGLGAAVTMTPTFEALLGGGVGVVGAADLIGLEHEYRLSRSGQAVDFRTMIHGWPSPAGGSTPATPTPTAARRAWQ